MTFSKPKLQLPIEVGCEDVEEVLLSDGWHRPDPQTLWTSRSRVAITTLSGQSVEISPAGGDPSDLVGWNEERQGVKTSVVIRQDAIIGIRIRDTGAISAAHIDQARQEIRHIRHYWQGTPQPHILEGHQRLISFWRDINPKIPSDPVDTWHP